MALFRVTIRNIKKPEISQVLDLQAPNREQASALAAREGFRIAMIKPISGGESAKRSKKGISKKELIKMFRGLASMLKANISTADALLYYAQGLPDPMLQTALYNIRERWRPEDDWLPERLLSEALPTGVASGVGLSRDELRDMVGGYYAARQWDERGFVPEWKVDELGIPAAAKEGHRCPATRPAAS